MPRKWGPSLLVAAAPLLLVLATGCGGSGDPVRIGVITNCVPGDPVAQTTPAWIAGAELPLLQRGGRLTGVKPSDEEGRSAVEGVSVAGRPIDLEIGCAESYNPSAVLAQLRWLVENRHVDAVVGPTNEADPIVARYARMHREVVFMLASYDQSSTLRFSAPNVFRFELDGAQWSAGLAAHAYHQLGWRNVTTVVEDEPSGWVQAAGFDAEFCALGGHVESLFAPPAGTHLGDLVSEVSAEADGVFLPSLNQDVSGFISRWGRDHVLARQLVLGPDYLGGPQLRGVVTVNSVPWVWAKNSAYGRYQAAFNGAFPHLGHGAYYSGLTYYDEVEPLLEALQHVRGDTSAGEQVLQRALARLHYASPEGLIHLDKRNQAIARTYLARIEHGGYRQFRVVRNVDQSFGGYFRPHSVPPGPHLPCVKRRPPPWAVRPTR
jgi:ABC-type branched-subunit amino acid transport system substrate-binding protein